jgi:hypothetical protein
VQFWLLALLQAAGKLHGSAAVRGGACRL